jgi:hypothetical protein
MPSVLVETKVEAYSSLDKLEDSSLRKPAIGANVTKEITIFSVYLICRYPSSGLSLSSRLLNTAALTAEALLANDN